jgi:hypothetical protein
MAPTKNLTMIGQLSVSMRMTAKLIGNTMVGQLQPPMDGKLTKLIKWMRNGKYYHR